jgi:hypothetical protein
MPSRGPILPDVIFAIHESNGEVRAYANQSPEQSRPIL